MKKSTIFEFLDVLYCKIAHCAITENTLSKLDGTKSNERNSINYFANLGSCCWLQRFAVPLLMVATLMTTYTGDAQNIQGLAPVIAPKGGFAIDGNAFVRYPGDNTLWGDFLFEVGETNVGANPGGIFVPVPPPYNYPDGPLPSEFYVYPNTTFFRDNITNNDPTTFTSSNKINDPVSSFTWGAGSSPNKNEIQNAIAHFTYGDPALGGVATDLWMIFAADRQVTDGSSYIDFEILQSKLTMEMNGTFSSEAGTLSGRTIGDLLVTIEFTQGGDFAKVVTRRWDGTSYIEFTPAVGTIFGTNNTGETIVPYPIYNQDPISTNPNLWAYEANQWAEGAVNITSFFGNDPCFVISTLFVRTRTSGSSGQSELKDFPGAPFQLDLSFVPDAPTVTSITRCDPGIVALSASGCPGGTLTWYDAATNGNVVATGSSYSPNITQTTSYWVSCTNSRGCEGPRTQVTGTVNVISPGTIDGSQILCTPFDPVAFTSTTPATGTGTLTYQWQISTTGCNGTWSDIPNATLATYDAPAVAVETNFRRVATSTLNGVACPAISNCLTVTPNNVTSGSIAGDQTLCTPFDPIAFTNTTAGTGSGPVTYQWQISTTGCTGTWTNITNATAAIYDAPTVSVTTYFRRVTTSTLNGVLCSANSNCLTVTPNPVTPGVISGDQTGCAPFDPAAFTSSSAGTGGGAITYQWQISTTGCNGTWSNIANATAATYDAPSVSAITNFRRVTTSTVDGIACSANSNCLTVTPSGVTAGEIAGSQTLCSPFDPAAFTSTTAGTGTGLLTYQWQSNTTGCDSTWSNIANATAETYDAPAVAVVTYFRRVTTSTVDGVPCIANSNCLTVAPNNVSGGAIAGDQTLCSPFDPAAFTSTTAGTGSGTITYQWQISSTACSGPWTNIAMATSATYDAPVVSVVTYFRRVTTSALNGVLCSANSNCLTVTPESINPGTIAGSQTLCTPFDPVAFTSTTPATNGGVISYQWQMSTISCSAGFTNIVGANSATYDAAAVSVVTYFRRVATSTLNGTNCPDFSNCLTVTPNNVSGGAIAGDQTLCSPFDPAAFTSTTAGTGTGTITYQWQISTTACSGPWTNIDMATSATYDAPVVSVVSYFRRVTTSTLGGVQCSANSNCLTVTPESINPGTIAGSQTLCSPFDPVAFTSTTPATNGGVISYQWQMSTISCSSGFTDIVGANSATYDAAAVSVVTYFRRVATSTLNGTNCPDFSNCLTVTPNNVSSGSIAGDQEVCIGDDVAAFTSTTPGSGSAAVTYQWQSNTTGCGGDFTNIEGATLATYDPGVASVTTYYRRVATSTLNGVLCSANSNCLTVIAESCAEALCTYTQGYYGNLGGMSCAPDNGGFTKYTTLALIERALTFYGGTMTIGSLGNTVVITNTPTDRMAIIDVLPGGGKSYVLSGSYSISALPGSYLKNGNINNTLLAQTIVLGLNIGINGALGDFALQGGTLVTAESQGGCGSDIAKTRICNPDGTVTNDYEYYSISPNVVAAITGDKTVQGLFDLANRALGGGAINGLSLSEIASAVDMINNAFDGCRIFVGYNIPRCNETTPGIPTIDAKVESAGFDAYPVPFKDQLTIKYKFDYVTDVKIEVFNAQGIMILSKTDANGYLNKEIALNLSINVGKEQVYVVKVTTNRGSTVKKVMSSK